MVFNMCAPAQVLFGEFVFQFYCGYLYIMTFPFLYDYQCSAWKHRLKIDIVFLGINLSADLIMAGDLGLSLFTVPSPELCWKTLKGCSCSSEMYCPVLISPATMVCGYKLSCTHPDPLASCVVKHLGLVWRTVGGPRRRSTVHPTKLQSSSYWLLKSITKSLITSENSSVTG